MRFRSHLQRNIAELRTVTTAHADELYVLGAPLLRSGRHLRYLPEFAHLYGLSPAEFWSLTLEESKVLQTYLEQYAEAMKSKR